jgi:RNA polymerase sigma factor (sigma-70 family)
MGRVEAEDAAGRVEALIARHGPALLRVANQFSLCQDDALDAYQHALEIYLRRLDTVEVATEGAWMRVVVKHEAMAIRRARQGSVDHDHIDLDDSVPSATRDVDDHVASGERVQRSVEALRALKPDEAKALMLKAEGLSYEEIGRRFGWTYTKVNRSITEGRARFLEVFRGIEAGEACDTYTDALAALAEGTATRAQLLELRPHLRHCAACRAVVRELRLSRRRRVALFAPLSLWRIASGVRHHGVTAYNRISDPTPIIAARPGAVAAAVAGCIAVGSGATYCVKADVDPIAGLAALARATQHSHAKAKPRAKPHPPRKRPHHTTTAPPKHAVIVTATPTPTAHHAPIRRATATPAPVATATAAPPPPAPQDEFQPSTTHATSTHTTPTRAATPAPAASGGGEFSGP